jgi:hypothetical protein
MIAYRTAILIPLYVACSGCGNGLIDLKATVTLDGKPVDGASVTLHPEETNELGRISSGVTAADGTVRFTTFEPNDGVPPGAYKVVVLKAPQNVDEEFANVDRDDPDVLLRMAQRKAVANVPYTPSLLPRIYLNPQRSPLKCDVSTEHDQATFALETSAGD